MGNDIDVAGFRFSDTDWEELDDDEKAQLRAVIESSAGEPAPQPSNRT